MSEHTWTKVAEGKSIKKRPSDNNNQSFAGERISHESREMKWTMKRKLKIARYDKY